jgi:hypothetical protein
MYSKRRRSGFDDCDIIMGVIEMIFPPFVVSLSNHEAPFDKLRVNGTSNKWIN